MKPSPRVLLTTDRYRLVHDGEYFTRLEVEDGHDRMGVRRWKDPFSDENSALLESVVGQIGDALIARGKRRKVRRVR